MEKGGGGWRGESHLNYSLTYQKFYKKSHTNYSHNFYFFTKNYFQKNLNLF